MEKSALRLDQSSPPVELPAVADDSVEAKVVLIPYLPVVRAQFVEAKMPGSKGRGLSKRFLSFLALELSAFVLLVMLLFAATSQRFAEPGLTLPFSFAILAAATAVAVIPVIFYGSTRQRYKYRSRRYHRR